MLGKTEKCEVSGRHAQHMRAYMHGGGFGLGPCVSDLDLPTELKGWRRCVVMRMNEEDDVCFNRTLSLSLSTFDPITLSVCRFLLLLLCESAWLFLGYSKRLFLIVEDGGGKGLAGVATLLSKRPLKRRRIEAMGSSTHTICTCLRHLWSC